MLLLLAGFSCWGCCWNCSNGEMSNELRVGLELIAWCRHCLWRGPSLNRQFHTDTTHPLHAAGNYAHESRPPVQSVTQWLGRRGREGLSQINCGTIAFTNHSISPAVDSDIISILTAQPTPLPFLSSSPLPPRTSVIQAITSSFPFSHNACSIITYSRLTWVDTWLTCMYAC